jgi:3-hydroxyisobutyrate dehydrogenase
MSPAATAVGRLMLAQDFAPRFPIDLLAKDFGYALASAEQLGVQVPVATAAQVVFERARAAGFGADNMSAVAQLYLRTS